MMLLSPSEDAMKPPGPGFQIESAHLQVRVVSGSQGAVGGHEPLSLTASATINVCPSGVKASGPSPLRDRDRAPALW